MKGKGQKATKEINEISDDLKKRYVKAATKDNEKREKNMRMRLANGSETAAKADRDKGTKREKGIRKAMGYKEDVDIATQNKKTLDMKDNKSNQLSQAITLLASMSGDEINHLLQTLQQNSQTASASIPNDAAAKNAASIAMKGAVAEELETIFGGAELTEQFKEEVTTLFEAAVSARVAVALTEKEEQFDALLTEQTAQIVEELTDNVDRYLSYIAEEWLKENEIAIESGIRTEIAEQFIHGLKNLFQEHYIEIPDEKVDVVETMAEEIKSLQDQLNATLDDKIALEEKLYDAAMEEVFEEVSTGLAMTEVEKFRTLAEGVDFTGDIEKYQNKLNIIKEKHFTKKTTSNKSLVLNETLETGDDSTNVSPASSIANKYAEIISRTAKN